MIFRTERFQVGRRI